MLTEHFPVLQEPPGALRDRQWAQEAPRGLGAQPASCPHRGTDLGLLHMTACMCNDAWGGSPHTLEAGTSHNYFLHFLLWLQPISIPFFFFFLFCFFLGLHMWHKKVPRPGVESELQLPAYTTARATREPSHISDLHCSLWQCRILNLLSGACIPMDTSRVRNPLSHNGHS